MPSADRSDAGRVLFVSKDSEKEYQSIQAAVDDAEEGDTVEVRPGIYHEEVHLSKTIALKAPDGAVLDGEGLGRRTKGTVHGLHIGENTRGILIEPGADIEPEIEGFVVRGYELGVKADKTNGSWVLRNVKLERNGEDGITAIESKGCWEVHDSVIGLNLEEGIDGERSTGSWIVDNTLIERNGDDGIDADGKETSADWIIKDSTIRNNGDHGLELKNCTGSWTIVRSEVVNNKSGVGAHTTSGDWSIEQSNLSGNHFVGVRCPNASGDWSITNVLIENTSTAVWAPATTGDWVIEDSFLGDTYFVPNDNLGEGTAVFAPYTRGNWEINNSSIGNVALHGIDASEADPEGDATGNWWSPRDSSVIENAGSVDCSDPRQEPLDGRDELLHVGVSVETSFCTRRSSSAKRTIDEVSTGEIVDLLAERVDKLHPSGGS